MTTRLVDMPSSRLRNWWFSAVLLTAYILSFSVWARLPGSWVNVCALLVVGGLTVALLQAGRRSYFLNSWDCVFHALVILDLLAEGLWVEHGADRSFYGCAIGFALVIGGYRWYIQTQRKSRPVGNRRGRGADKATPSLIQGRTTSSMR